jgi:hypothetical protein
MLRRVREAYERFMHRQIDKHTASLERELAMARKDPNVSLKDVKRAEKLLEEARNSTKEKGVP